MTSPPSSAPAVAGVERYTPEYIARVVAELESRGWVPDSRGEPDCCDEASAAGADIIRTLQARTERLRHALKTVGDDYPGSSCQKWCYEQAGIPLPEPALHPVMAQLLAPFAPKVQP